MAIVGFLDQRIAEVAQGALVVGQLEARSLACGAGIGADPIVNAVAHQAGTYFAEISVGATAQQRDRRKREYVPAPNERPPPR